MSHTNQPTAGVSSKEEAKKSMFNLDSDVNQTVLVALLFISVLVIYFKIQVTLISLPTAGLFLLLFGLIGFGLIFIFRKQLNLSMQDALLYSTFSAAPVGMALLLGVNGVCSTEYEETFPVVGYESVANGFELQLENGAYTGVWQMLTVESMVVETSTVTYTLCDGLLGYKEVKDIETRK